MSDWSDWRRGGIGASDIAAAATGKYGGAVGVVADKLGIGTDDIDPALAARGQRWEQPIANAVHAARGQYVHGEQAWCEHPEQPHHRATIDGFLHPNAEVTLDEIDTLVEIKTRGVTAPWSWDYWRHQTQWQMHVTGMTSAVLAIATIDDIDDTIQAIRFETVERDQWAIDQLVDLAEELWAHVQAGTLPDPDTSSALEAIRSHNATADPTAVADIDDQADLIADYADLKARAKAASEELALAEAKIRAAMGEATEATTSDGRWRVRCGEPIAKFTRDSEAEALAQHPDYGRTVLDRQRFKAERPDDYDHLKRPTADRRLTIKEMHP